jgi:hypothetical protein
VSFIGFEPLAQACTWSGALDANGQEVAVWLFNDILLLLTLVRCGGKFCIAARLCLL